MFENVCVAKVWMSLGVICYVLLAKAWQLRRGQLVSAKGRFIKKFPNRQASLYLFSRKYIELNAVSGGKKKQTIFSSHLFCLPFFFPDCL